MFTTPEKHNHPNVKSVTSFALNEWYWQISFWQTHKCREFLHSECVLVQHPARVFLNGRCDCWCRNRLQHLLTPWLWIDGHKIFGAVSVLWTSIDHFYVHPHVCNIATTCLEYVSSCVQVPVSDQRAIHGPSSIISEPRFSLKGMSFPSVLNSGSSSHDVYTSDKLNFR